LIINNLYAQVAQQKTKKDNVFNTKIAK